MKLRAKILLLIASLMGILYVLVAGTLIPELTDTRIRLRRDLGRSSANEMVSWLAGMSGAEVRRTLLERQEHFRAQLRLNAWAVADDENRVVAWSRPEPPPERLGESAYREYDLVLPFSPQAAEGRPWKLYAVFPVLDFSVSRELWSLFTAMLLGSVILGVAVYGLVLRLVIKPMERLASASRAGISGRGVLAEVPHSDRTDEVGELIRAYNSMVREVNDLRVNLETRVAHAVGELEQAQKQLLLSERLSVTGRLAAGVAHEINNPLGGMLNAARALQKKAAAGTREAEYLELIAEGLGRIQAIVSTMLRFARPAAQKASVDLAEVMEGALLFCKHRLASAQTALRREFPPPEAPRAAVAGNSAELGQVFLNLLVNALDALERKQAADASGGCAGELVLSLRREDARILASVRDTGVGMSPEVRARAFDLFFSTKSEGRGTGLGLAIVAHIVQAHGGTLEIESTVGQGTTVRLNFPAEREATETARKGA